jgi:hypothetical protein
MDAAHLARLAYLGPDVVAALYARAHATSIDEDADADADAVADAGMLDVLRRVGEAPRFFTDARTDAQAYGVQYAGVSALVYRGTSSVADALVDACVRRVQVPWLPDDRASVVHRGFLMQFLALRPACAAYLEAAGGARDVLCIGHSLGSAVAALAASAAAVDPVRRVHYVGFGTPRVGNAAWAASFDKSVATSVRCKNGRDPVAAVPPRVLYADVGGLLHIGRPDPIPDVPSLLDLWEHDMAEYLRHLPGGATPEAPAGWAARGYGALVNTPVWLCEAVQRLLGGKARAP